MILRPPRSTLFPYTTLFRSLVRSSEPAHGEHFGVDIRILADHVGVDERRNPNIHPEIDRKSTRLNSSHRCISYAVFCLKKKKKYKTKLKNIQIYELKQFITL